MKTVLIKIFSQQNITRPINLKRLALSVTPVGLGQAALLVYLPILVDITPLGYSQWAQLFALGMLFYFMGSVLWPLLLPTLGYKRIIHWSLTGFSASMALLGLGLVAWNQNWIGPVSCITVLGFSRVIYGLFASALVPACQAGCIQLSNSDNRLKGFSTISLYLALSRTLGPLLALVAAALHWLGPVLMLLMFPMAILLANRGFTYPTTLDSNAPPNQSLIARINLKQLKAPLAFLMIAMAATAFASSLQFMAAPILEQLLNSDSQATTRWLGALLVSAALVTAIAHFLQSKMPPQFPTARMMGIGFLLAACGLGLFTQLTLGWLALMVLIASAGLAWLTPLYSTRLSQQNPNHHEVATQLSLSHLAGHFVGLTISAQLLEMNLSYLFGWLVVLGLLMVSATICWGKPP